MANEDFTKKLDEDYPTSIRMAEGNTIVADFVRIDKANNTEYGDTFVMVVDGVSGDYEDISTNQAGKIEAGKKYGLWLFHTALISQLKQAKPKPGERIAVKYRGKRQGEKFAYHDYRVVVDRETDFTWDDLSSDDASDSEKRKK